MLPTWDPHPCSHQLSPIGQTDKQTEPTRQAEVRGRMTGGGGGCSTSSRFQGGRGGSSHTSAGQGCSRPVVGVLGALGAAGMLRAWLVGRELGPG